MARILFTVVLLLTTTLTAQASFYCQCLFQDGSHCCIAQNDGGCQNVCRRAYKFDHTECNADGKYSDVSFFTAQGRKACLNV